MEELGAMGGSKFQVESSLTQSTNSNQQGDLWHRQQQERKGRHGKAPGPEKKWRHL